ncbi:hypothetical protein ANN_21140 [Periplaneta americana]|uniref:Reverse transcriptase domain-containing protein n=1 Tax=Periplaneta americana TaxID=6978 RepID=A0ABQ8SEY3_PERAM|nr:hypothetical protein ANN_21140 [Periplaneta americana]
MDLIVQYDYLDLTVASNVRLGHASPLSYGKGCSEREKDRILKRGHRPNTTTALLKVIEDTREASDRGELTLLTLLDFSKAFDTVDTDLLLCKLKNYNLSNSAVAWFDSYLREHQQVYQPVVILPIGVPSRPESLRARFLGHYFLRFI